MSAGAFQDVHDQQQADEVELSENVAEDYVEYHRGEVVGHEEEGFLMYLGVLTGWIRDQNTHVNTIGQGPPGSGKSLTKNTVEGLLPDLDTYTKTDATDNAILDSVEWDLALAAPLDEIDKIDKAIVEVLKSSNPEDGGYAKDRNVEDPDAPGGYAPVEVSADANPWVLLYAPSSKKGGINDELEDRALLLYFSNDKHTRRGIGRKEFGHENISTPEYDDEYIYDTHELAARLRQHVRDLPVDEHYEDDDGDTYLASRSGDTLVWTPRWVWYAVEPIFNIDEDYTNRVYGLVNNLIQASALLNHENRETRDVETYVDEDSSETETREAVVVHKQDVANVLSCLPTLLSTTHQLTPLKRHILDAVDATEGVTDNSGTTVSKVQSWLEDNDIPHPSRSTLKNRMDDLAEDYYLDKFESSAGPKGQADAYEKCEQGALQPPRVSNLQEHADKDDVQLAVEDCVTIDPDAPFEGVTDPFRDQPFVETVKKFRADFNGVSVDDPQDESIAGLDDEYVPDWYDGDSMDASDAMSGGESDDSGEQDDGQASLTDVTEDGVSDDSDQSDAAADSSDVSLDPDGMPETPTEAWLLQQLQESGAGGVFGSQHDVSHYVGTCSPDQSVAQVDVSGTVLDPDHDLWQDRPDMTDDRVINESDALRELNGAYGELRQKGLVVEDDDAGPPAMYVLRVANPYGDGGAE